MQDLFDNEGTLDQVMLGAIRPQAITFSNVEQDP